MIDLMNLKKVFSIVSAVSLSLTCLSSAMAVTKGTVAQLRPAVGQVGYVSNSKNIFNCSGTLIGSRTVLTSAYCVDDGADAIFKSHMGEVFTGVATRHPDFISPKYDYDSNIAIISLDRYVSRYVTMPLCNSFGIDQQIGVTLVGWGQSSAKAKDSGVKRVAKNRLSSVTATELIIKNSGPQPCFGDNGSPAIINSNAMVSCIAGVASALYNPQCIAGAIFARTDSKDRIDWIKDTARANQDSSVMSVTPRQINCYTDEGGESCTFNTRWDCYSDEGGTICGWARKREEYDDQG